MFPDSMCMERLLFVIFCPMPDIRKAINSLLLLFSYKLNKKHAWSKLSVLPPSKNWMWNRSFMKCIFYFLKTVLFFDISRASSSSSFLFTNFSSKILKYPQALVLINLWNQLLVQVLGGHQAVHRFYHQVLFVLHPLLLLFFLFMFVFDNHINY